MKEQNCNLEPVSSFTPVVYPGQPRQSTSSPGRGGRTELHLVRLAEASPSPGVRFISQWAIKSFVTDAKLLLERNKSCRQDYTTHSWAEQLGLPSTPARAHQPLAAQTEAQVKRELNTGTESPAHGWCRQKMHIQCSDFNVEYKICNKSCVLQFGVAPLTCRQEGWG